MVFDLQRCKAYKIFSGKVVVELTITYSIGFARLTPKRTNAERIGTRGRKGSDIRVEKLQGGVLEAYSI